MKWLWAIGISIFIIISFQLKALDAPAALRPSGLNPGDTYFVMFVASTTEQRFCDTQNTADINNHGINAAAAGSVTSGVTGWQSLYIHESSAALGTITDTVAASGSAFNNVTNRPIYNTMLQLVANDRTDLFDGSASGAGTALINQPSFDQDGNNYTGLAFTGFDELGNRQVGFTLGYGGTGCLVGDPDSATTADWVSFANSNGSRSIYVLSPLLTIPAATPAAPVPKISTFPYAQD